MSSDLSIGFIGAGKMACALARGFLRASLVKPEAIAASDVQAEALKSFSDLGAATLADNIQVTERSRTVILAVKPAQVLAVLREIGPALTTRHLVVSIAAGLPLRRLEENLPPSIRVVRVMPNTPALVGASASAYACGQHADRNDAALVQRLFSAVGLALEVPESLLDAVTGLSGSGPAYVCLMIEALSDGGVAAGLPRDVATRLAAQTLLGTARMVLETGSHPGQLKDMVTSPGGTTIEGLHQLERGGLRAALMDAVRASAEKSRKLGQG